MPGDPAQRGGQAVTPTTDAVWAPPGRAAQVIPPQASASPANGYQPPPIPSAPVPTPAPRQARRRGGVWVISGAAVVLGGSAGVKSVIPGSRPAPPPITTTITAAAPAYSADDVAAAKKEACEASARATAPINQAQQAFTATVGDRSSPEYRAALASWQTVLAVETQYMRYHIPPETPQNIADATNDYIKALIALGDANTREVSDSAADKFIADTRTTGDRL